MSLTHRVNWLFKDDSYLPPPFIAPLLVSPLSPTHAYTHAFKSFLALLANFWLLPFHLIMSFSQAPPLWFVGPRFEPGPVTTGLLLSASPIGAEVNAVLKGW